MKILLVKLSALGDVVQTLPVLAALKRAGHEVHWLVEEAAAQILEGHPLLDGLLVSRRRLWLDRWRKDPQRVWGEVALFVRSLRQEEYDLVLDLQGLLKSALLVALARARLKVGFANHREGSPWFYNFPLPPYDPEEHAVRRYLSALGPLGLEVAEPEFVLPPLPEEVPQRWGLTKPYVVLIPCARWLTKHWAKSHWQELAQALLRQGRQPVLVGAKADLPYVEEIVSGVDGALSLCGRLNLLELASLLKGAERVISVDTGPMHLAAAVGARVIALFGPTAPWRTGPFGEGHVVLRVSKPCSPCFRRRCPEPCLEEIRPQEVLAALSNGHTRNRA